MFFTLSQCEAKIVADLLRRECIMNTSYLKNLDIAKYKTGQKFNDALKTISEKIDLVNLIMDNDDYRELVSELIDFPKDKIVFDFYELRNAVLNNMPQSVLYSNL